MIRVHQNMFAHDDTWDPQELAQLCQEQDSKSLILFLSRYTNTLCTVCLRCPLRSCFVFVGKARVNNDDLRTQHTVQQPIGIARIAGIG